MKFYAAIKGVSRINDSPKIGAYKISITESENRFKFFAELSTLTPHVYIPLLKLGLSLVKGLRFEGDKRYLVRDFENWAKRIGFVEKIQTLARLFVRNGTYVGIFQRLNNPNKLTFEPLLMEKVSILPKGMNRKETPGYIMEPPVDSVWINEFDDKYSKSYKINDCVFGAFCPYDYVIKDIYGRNTYGIYGISILEPVADLVRKYLDLIEGYVRYIRKYGVGRYFIKYTILEELIMNGQLKEAQEAIEELRKEHEQISENEDIIGVGFDIKELDAKGNLDIVEFKESLETDIQVGLLQHPLTMGRTKGTTYAAGYVSEADRMIVLEGLQRTLKEIINREIIDKRLSFMGKPEGSVWVEFEELSKPEAEIRDLLDLYVNGVITEEELRIRAGFSPEKVENE